MCFYLESTLDHRVQAGSVSSSYIFPLASCAWLAGESLGPVRAVTGDWWLPGRCSSGALYLVTRRGRRLQQPRLFTFLLIMSEGEDHRTETLGKPGKRAEIFTCYILFLHGCYIYHGRQPPVCCARVPDTNQADMLHK